MNNESIKKKREEFARQIRSEKKQAYFEKQRKKLFEAQDQGDIDIEKLIIADLVAEFGSEEKVYRMLAEYDAYEKSRDEYQAKVEQEEQASMNFQKLQEQQKLKRDMEALALLFEEMEEDENTKEQKDIEI